MKADNEKLSALIDNEVVDESLLNELIKDEIQQATYSRYNLIGDVMRDEVSEPLLNIDLSQTIMAEINAQPSAEIVNIETLANKKQSPSSSNIISFGKRFGQYAIAASVAGIVVMATLVNSPTVVENNDNGLEVLSTVPFGGAAAPVSLDTTRKESKEVIKERAERFDALLKDHQLQLQMQP